MDASNALSAVKSLLQKAQPHLLARLLKVTAREDVLSVVIDPSVGLTCKKLNAEEINLSLLHLVFCVRTFMYAHSLCLWTILINFH